MVYGIARCVVVSEHLFRMEIRKGEIIKLHYSGKITVVRDEHKKKPIPKWDKIYRYSDSVLGRLRNAERAFNGHLSTLKYAKCYLITVTYPLDTDQEERFRYNALLADNVRKKFTQGYLWCAEAHTGKNDQRSRGKIHFHYKIITDKGRKRVLAWFKKIHAKYGLPVNGIDVSKKAVSSEAAKEGIASLYAGLYASKELQKTIVQSKRRIWATGGYDKNSISLPTEDLAHFLPEVDDYSGLRSSLKDVNIIIAHIKISSK